MSKAKKVSKAKKAASTSRPLVTEFWLMEPEGASWAFVEEYTTKKKMLAAYASYKRDDATDDVVPAVLTVMRLKP